jgi:hypothetical protein
MTDHPFILYDVTSPVGAIIAYAGNVEPYKAGNSAKDCTIQPENFGWMLCDGSQLNAYEYPELYAALGKLYTPGGLDESIFALPNLQGQFLRGVGTDQASTEHRKDASGNTSTGIGSVQQSAIQTHQHNYQEAKGAQTVQNGTDGFSKDGDAWTDPPAIGEDTGSIEVSQYETRPVNVFVYYLIKYTYALPKYNGPGLPFF